MIGKLIPIVIALIGLGAGVGAGIALRPAPTEMVAMENPCGDVGHDDMKVAEGDEPEEDDASEVHSYVKLNNQFVIPIVNEARVESLVVMSLSLEVDLDTNEDVYRVEPKLRDALLQTMFSHANAGGFSGPFTETARMRILRQALLETASKILGDIVSDVLIIDVVRQDA